ncbi:hypothetical protein, partial [Candidatus Solincola tengchongensis]|uniref:hypothetical protein n=1 Tax=Candidatus Solincola tengchongensis TaxID=2900693 RepID=UPI00257E8C54
MRRMLKGLVKVAAWCSTCGTAAPVCCARHFRSERREPAVWSPGRDETLIIRDVEIVDVVGGTVLHRRCILVREGRI